VARAPCEIAAAAAARRPNLNPSPDSARRPLPQEWAVKIMTLPPPGARVAREAGESSREDILKEIDILFSLAGGHHPNIIHLKEYFEEGGRVYIVMEYLKVGGNRERRGARRERAGSGARGGAQRRAI
jgi:serine/threonine protein kinase